MGFGDRDDISDDLVSDKGNPFSGILKKIRIPFAMLIVGIIIGALLMHTYGEPFLTRQISDPSDSLKKTNELLNKENDCLYNLLDNSKEEVKKCGQTFAQPPTQ